MITRFSCSRALPLLLLTGHAFAQNLFDWQMLPDLPVPLAGHFVGRHNDALIVAGGSSWPISPWEGGEKQWHDAIYVLTPGAEAWRHVGTLPRAIGYGTSITTPRGLLCVGGANSEEHFPSVWRLSWTGDVLLIEAFPSLPEPAAMTAGALVGQTAYVLGGHASPRAASAFNRGWALDLAEDPLEWRSSEPWPGPARILPAVAAHNNALYLFSGAELFPGPNGLPQRRYLSDAYRYTPGAGWDLLEHLPYPVVGAPALGYGQASVFVFGGDSGEHAERVQELAGNHPGFTHNILAYHAITGTWSVKGQLLEAYVTTGVVLHNGRIVIPGGEDRPGHRAGNVLSGVPLPSAPRFGWINMTVVALYFALLVAMGFYFARRENTTQDFFLAGKRVPWWAMGISIFGTQLSAITFLSIPARAYATDWVYVWANAGIVLITPYVVFAIIPKYHARPYTTAYEYLEYRFNVAVRLYGALVFLLFQAGRTGIVLFLPALALRAATGLDVYLCIALMGILATLYTVLGGIEAVIWTDVLQVLVLTAGVLLSFMIILTRIEGGPAELFAVANAAGKFHMNNWTWDPTMPALWLCVIGNIFAVAYPYTADQTLVQRYLASASRQDAVRATWTNAILAIPATLIFFLMGTALYVYFKAHPEQIDPTLPNDGVFPLFIVQQLPAGPSGLVIAAIFAASMSSLDSSLNSISTVLVNDFYRRFRSPFTDAHGLRVARVLTVVFGALATGSALLMAGRDVQSIFNEYMRILGLTGGGLAGIVALGMLTRRANSWGALTGAAFSAAAVYYVATYTQIHLFAYALIGFATACVIGYAASLVLRQR